MQLNERTLDLTSGGLEQNQTFKIKTTSKAFSILSDKLYSDKVSAVIRELSCNAFDAMILAGRKDEPFSVHLPNSLEPWFSVSDTGVGLSHEDIMTLYTTYFDSTKTGSNDFIGALGLGSKSPFSLVDSFTVESTFNGVRTSYTAYLDEARLPTIAKLGETETTDSNGMVVKVPVSRTMFSDFTSKAKKILRFFTPTPNVEGSSDYKQLVENPILSGKNWAIIESDRNSYNRGGGAEAIMGNVAYPIRANNLGSVDYEVRQLFDANLRFYFGIGDLDIAPSREELSYDDSTKKILLERVSTFSKEVAKVVCDQIAKAKDEYEARLEFKRIYNVIPYHCINKAVNDDLIKFNGVVIKGSTRTVNFIKDFPTVTVAQYESYRSRSHSFADLTRVNIEYDEQHKIYWNDLKKGAPTRIIQMLKSTSDREKVYLIGGVEEKDIPKISKFLGGYPIYPASDLDKPIPSTRAPTRSYFVSDESGYWYSRDVDFQKTIVGYYVPLNKDKAVSYSLNGTDKMFNPTAFSSLMQYAYTAKMLNTKYKVVGVKTGLKKFNKDNPGWVNLVDTVIAELATKKPTALDFDYRSELSDFKNKYGNKFDHLLDFSSKPENLVKLPATSPFRLFVEDRAKITKLVADSETQEVISKLKGMFGEVTTLPKRKQTALDLFKHLMEYYELLDTYTENYYYREDLPRITKYFNYILIVDKTKGV